jgi:hypothetical protein
VVDHLRAFVERRLPWYDPRAAADYAEQQQLVIKASRAARAQATRTMRDGYRAYGDRMSREDGRS